MKHYQEVKRLFLVYLEGDIEAHERGDFSSIGEASFWGFISPDGNGGDLDEDRLEVAFEFWDRWIDARNHNWGYHRGVERDDWPVIARQIRQGLLEEWDVDKMRDNLVFNPPPKPGKVSLWARLFSK